ncbi:hypothetical protein DVH26_18365 [Paenibacillus sp. H1-7]|uniref:hypothetical protein n=1 Tax=Paenibacillus sp. H1-7 TaxID=2282849 RepID=UPI001EF889F6|nr:hypothetical protein [Paenibacillus sp. H1-7]ULL16237.1 hypothetical protein DVH26_18365 [Paenibacillus sp. H1-7]
MTRSIQAYFHTENETEDVRIKLQKYNIDQLEIGALPEPLHKKVPLLIPLASASGEETGTAGGSYAGGSLPSSGSAAGAFVGFRSIDQLEHDSNHDGVDDRELLYSLSLKVSELDYNEAVKVIRSNGGHVAI